MENEDKVKKYRALLEAAALGGGAGAVLGAGGGHIATRLADSNYESGIPKSLYHVAGDNFVKGADLESLVSRFGDEKGREIFRERWYEAGDLEFTHPNQIFFNDNYTDAQDFLKYHGGDKSNILKIDTKDKDSYFVDMLEGPQWSSEKAIPSADISHIDSRFKHILESAKDKIAGKIGKKGVKYGTLAGALMGGATGLGVEALMEAFDTEDISPSQDLPPQVPGDPAGLYDERIREGEAASKEAARQAMEELYKQHIRGMI